MALKFTSKIDEIKRIGDLLDRDEWDFSSCPEDRLPFVSVPPDAFLTADFR